MGVSFSFLVRGRGACLNVVGADCVSATLFPLDGFTMRRDSFLTVTVPAGPYFLMCSCIMSWKVIGFFAGRGFVGAVDYSAKN